MAFHCEDLARYGVVLSEPSPEELYDLRADLERRWRARAVGCPPVDEEALGRLIPGETAVLENRADVAIAGLAYYWSVREAQGERAIHIRIQGGPQPKALDQRIEKFAAYWNTIFPGSRRLIPFRGGPIGDNTDVRPPGEDELRRGSGIGGGMGGSHSGQPREPARLTLDGVLFVDGGFAGPNKLGWFDRMMIAPEVRAEFAALAGSVAVEAFFAEVNKVVEGGDNPQRMQPHAPIDRVAIYEHERYLLGRSALGLEKAVGAQVAVSQIAGWGSAAPKLRRP